MRFLVVLKSYEPAYISKDYRSRFISLLKRIFGDEYKYSIARPYTFSVFFPNSQFDKDLIKNVDTINFRFSTGDSLIAIRFYNEILRMKNVNYIHPIGTKKFKIDSITEEKERKITGVFRTLSPVIVQKFNDGGEYLFPSESFFEESLIENILKRFSTINGYTPNVKKFKFKTIDIQNKKIVHYNSSLKAFLGKFKIDTDSEEILKFLYQYGIGVRTGQGFGYLEVEKSTH